KKAKGLLNKLTIEKFDTISDQFLALPINTQSLLKKVIELVFDKALDEHHFQNMYGRLCQKLSNELPKVQKWIDMDAKNNIFRRLLLNKCQEEFERSEKWSQTDADDALSRKERLQRLHEMSADEKAQYAEDEFQRNKLKRRVLGNISFIGELFKLQMITEKIMHNCVQQLLSKVVDPEEEETECLCKLLKSVGERLDHPAAKSHMDLYFTRIKELSVNQKLPARIRFMIQDLIEQRRSKWKAR
ncbi:armadillo-type protein, partial [Chytridium lagenaria]